MVHIRLVLKDTQNYAGKILTVPFRWQADRLTVDKKSVRLSIESLACLVTSSLDDTHHKSNTGIHILTTFAKELSDRNESSLRGSNRRDTTQ